MHRILKPTGSIFVHCDYHANAYIRVYILDKIFGDKNFRNELIWGYKRPSAPKQKQLSRLHDNIFWYSKSATWIFNGDAIRVPYAESSVARAGYVANASKMTDGGNVELKEGGKLPEDWWDIPMLKGNSKEWIGYPTQKPEALLERIIKMASNESDIVLDCFVGGGTTIAVADKLNRKWIGIDQSVQAIKVTEFRLNRQQNLFSKPFTVQLHKYDYDTLRYKDAFEFETWIVGQFGGLANSKQRSDLGLDGRTRENQPIQVKRSDNIGRNVIDNFKSACERYDKVSFEKNKAENKPVGFIIAFSFGKGAVHEVALPIYVMKLLGVRTLWVTNAAGGLSANFSVGDLMLINDHISFFLPDNPLRGNQLDFVNRFVDMRNAYTPHLLAKAETICQTHTIRYQKGIYAAVQGAMLETNAEYQLLRMVGANAVGMSTVPEVIAAASCSLEILGVAVITDMCTTEAPTATLNNFLVVAQKSAKYLGVLFEKLLASHTENL
jgi:inosine/guanosine/xanthosine phosphorylase family protein